MGNTNNTLAKHAKAPTYNKKPYIFELYNAEFNANLKHSWLGGLVICLSLNRKDLVYI